MWGRTLLVSSALGWFCLSANCAEPVLRQNKPPQHFWDSSSIRLCALFASRPSGQEALQGFRSQDSSMRNRGNAIVQLLLRSKENTLKILCLVGFFSLFFSFFDGFAGFFVLFLWTFTSCWSKKEWRGGVDHQNDSVKTLVCSSLSPVQSGFRVFGGFCSETGQQRVPNPRRERRQAGSSPAFPSSPLKLQSRRFPSPGAAAAAAVSALPAPSQPFFGDQSSLLRAKLFSRWCATG